MGIEARIGAEIPALGKIGWGALIVGSLFTFAAVRLLGHGVREPWDPSVHYRLPRGNWVPRRSEGTH